MFTEIIVMSCFTTRTVYLGKICFERTLSYCFCCVKGMIRALVKGILQSRLIEGQQPTYGMQLEGFLRVLPEMGLPKWFLA